MGATDYILKDRLNRLPLAIDRPIEEAIVKQEKESQAKELRDSQKLFSNIADTSPGMIWLSDDNGTVTWLNNYWLSFRGRTIKEEIGDGWVDGVHPFDKERCVSTYLKAFEKREPFQMEYRLRRHDGEYRWITDNGRAYFDSDGRFAGYIGVCLDVTDLKDTEKKIKRLNRVYAVLSDINQAIVRTRDIPELYQNACEIAVKQGGFRTA